jgi:hypothetical protein
MAVKAAQVGGVLYRKRTWYATTNGANGFRDKTARGCSGTWVLLYTIGERKNQKARR